LKKAVEELGGYVLAKDKIKNIVKDYLNNDGDLENIHFSDSNKN